MSCLYTRSTKTRVTSQAVEAWKVTGGDSYDSGRMVGIRVTTDDGKQHSFNFYGASIPALIEALKIAEFVDS